MTLHEIVILKDSPSRRVHLELESGRPARVVKHIPVSGLPGLRARRLARREFEVQRRLHSTGLSVPEPLACTVREGAVEIVQRYVDGARELARLLEGPEVIAGGTARRIGALLGRAHALGLDHPDLHERNLLVDDGGRPWLIDFHGARIARGPDPGRSRRDLIALAAATRERAEVRALRRAFVAWWRAAGERARPDACVEEFAAEIEQAARSRRRSVLARQTKRWERPSSSARAFDLGDGQRGMARAELDDRRLGALLDDARHSPRFEVGAEIAGLRSGATILVLHGVEPARVAASFLAFARLADHALDAARPVLHVKHPEAGALFAVPRGARPLSRAMSEAAFLRVDAARAIGRLYGALEDRGLALDLRGREPWIDRDETPRAWITPPAWLVDRPLDRSGAPWRAALAELADATACEARELVRAWLAEQRSGPRIQRGLRDRIQSDLGARLDG